MLKSIIEGLKHWIDPFSSSIFLLFESLIDNHLNFRANLFLFEFLLNNFPWLIIDIQKN